MKANCNRCQQAAAVYCTAETAFMCATCDSQAHGTNAVACRHTRLALCQLCESAPATIFCKNDDAKLCASCDAQIHVSNPLAARHERVPLSAQSYPETQHSVCAPLGSSGLTHSSSSASLSDLQVEAVPQLPNSPFGLELEPDVKGLKEFDAFDFDGDLFDMGMGFDLGTLDMDFIGAPVKAENLDGVVPTLEQSSCCSSENESIEVDGFAQQTSCTSSLTAQTTPFSTTNGSDAIAAMPAVPTALPRPAPAALPAKLWSATSQPEVLLINSDGLMTREARVLRYRQKRARRTFQKTIRYQSRKAYAEIRPRIKGRFATREEVLALKAEQALKAAAAGSASAPTMVPCAL